MPYSLRALAPTQPKEVTQLWGESQSNEISNCHNDADYEYYPAYCLIFTNYFFTTDLGMFRKQPYYKVYHSNQTVYVCAHSRPSPSIWSQIGFLWVFDGGLVEL